ncbi:hypothetical protein GLYMA_06G172766v4 [Glycine max]|nr:hypothetical protein GLYMA_06G172766v4 [Glycine max]KAH1126399.1 hypothetical protein GYH30_015401 [Glycine max]
MPCCFIHCSLVLLTWILISMLKAMRKLKVCVKKVVIGRERIG